MISEIIHMSIFIILLCAFIWLLYGCATCFNPPTTRGGVIIKRVGMIITFPLTILVLGYKILVAIIKKVGIDDWWNEEV